MSSLPSQEPSTSEKCVALLTIANERAMAGDMEAAISHFRLALEVQPDNSLIHDDLVYLLYFHPGYDDQAIFHEMMIWERRHAQSLTPSIQPHKNSRDPNRRLKVGYVSPEFCRQAESFFVLPLLQSHDHHQFEIHCYSSVTKPDDRTEQIRACADVWHDVKDLDDAALAEQIRGDQMDILIDLTMHMRMSRMLTFARKPAPVQVAWLAYPGGTGLRTMDYRLTDRFLDPPDRYGAYTEESWRLPDCWVCFDPCSQAALSTPRTGGPICFGSLNHPRKMNDLNLRLWAKLMRRIDGSRIILHIVAEDHRERAKVIFQHEGIAVDRLEFVGLQPRWQYLRTYDRIDIALDTLPYNGITTTCDSLWMGTPVINLIGKTAAGRAGLGILSTVGLPELAVASPEQFIATTVQLAQDRARLIDLRKNLRRRVKASPLMDARKFARNVESAYRGMWQRWCGSFNPAPLEPIPAKAFEYHQTGRLGEAEAIYRQILQRQPGHPDALNLLGLLAGQTGHHQQAIELISRAISVNNSVAAYHNNLAVTLQKIGRLDEALAAYRRTISLDPGSAEAYSNLGNAFRLKGDLDQAIQAFRQAVELKPDFANALGNLGNVLKEKGDLDAAITALRRAAELNPNAPAAHSNLGIALTEKGLLKEAIQCYRRAIDLDSRYAEAHTNLGNALMSLGQFDEGIRSIRRSIELRPADAAGYYNLGTALRETGRCDEAVAAFQEALRINPEYAEAHFNCSFSMLALGDFKRGWREHAWRARAQPRFLLPVETFTQPQWDGSDLNGRTIFLHAEQGFGDTIQFVRYAPLVAHRGGRVILACQSSLISLLKDLPGIEQIIAVSDPLPNFDLHCPLLSLPLVFSTDFDSIPARVPYLTANPDAVAQWKSRIDQPGFKVGLVWTGNPHFKNNAQRSLPLQQFSPLANVSGVEFFSLQKGEADQQIPPAGMKLIDWTRDLHNFADTAALIANLDLVITVDTSVAHLAGALGKPVWVLLAFVSDWRWLLNRKDSPWYPTMHLFRQNAGRNWTDVVQRVGEELAKKIQR